MTEVTITLDYSVFGRYLDLKPLGGRRRGLVRCRFHDDRSASLSVDLDAGVWHCFGCGQQGGVKRFAALVGEVQASPENPTNDEPSMWQCAMRIAARQPWARDGVHELYTISDYIRRERQRITRVRREATGEDAWGALVEVSDAERFVDALEVGLDTALETWHP